MKILHITLLLLVSMVAVNAEKVTWDANGKLHIASSSKPIKGCFSISLKALSKESNSSISCIN